MADGLRRLVSTESGRVLQEKLESWYRDYQVGRGRQPGRTGACWGPVRRAARLSPRRLGGREAACSGAVAAVPGPPGGFRGDGGDAERWRPPPPPGSAGALGPVRPKPAAGRGERVAGRRLGFKRPVWDVDPRLHPVITILAACGTRSFSCFLPVKRFAESKDWRLKVLFEL